MHYLDANATQPLRPAARGGRPRGDARSPGTRRRCIAAGRAARRIMEDAREVIAACFGGRPQDLVFTSGGTEADALAIHALSRGRRDLISAIEHDAIRSAAAGAVVLPVDRAMASSIWTRWRRMLADGVAFAGLPDAGEQRNRRDPAGAGRPPRSAGAHGALLHVDAVQAAGRMPVRLDRLGATAWRSRRTSWAARPVSGRCCWRRTRRSPPR